MSIQVLAVRVEGGSALSDIVEVIYRDDDDGKLGYMERAPFAEWVNDNPSIRVYLRDSIGDNRVVLTYKDGDTRYLRVAEATEARDPLLRLPRFITPTKPAPKEIRRRPQPSSKAKTIDPIASLWWFWWWPRD